MTTQQRVQYESFLRVRDFWATYRERFPGSSKAGAVFGTVAEVVADIEAQGQKRAHAVRDGRNGKAEAKADVLAWIRKVVRSSRDVARTGAGSHATLLMPRRVSDVGLLAAARVLFDAGKPFSASFIELGLPADWETAFKGAIDAFEERVHNRRVGRNGVADATAAIVAAVRRGRGAIRTLDTIVANALANEPVVMAAWLRSREVVGGSRSKSGKPTLSEVSNGAPAAEVTATLVTESEVLKQAS